MRIFRIIMAALSLALLIPFAIAFPAAASPLSLEPSFGDAFALPPLLDPLASIQVDELERELTALTGSYDGSAFIRFSERALLHDEFDGAGYVLELKLSA